MDSFCFNLEAAERQANLRGIACPAGTNLHISSLQPKPSLSSSSLEHHATADNIRKPYDLSSSSVKECRDGKNAQAMRPKSDVHFRSADVDLLSETQRKAGNNASIQDLQNINARYSMSMQNISRMQRNSEGLLRVLEKENERLLFISSTLALIQGELTVALKSDFENSLALVQAAKRSCERLEGSMYEADEIEDKYGPQEGANAVTNDQGKDSREQLGDYQ